MINVEHQNQEILRRLDKIQIDIDLLKTRMIDPDCILTEDDLEAINEAEKEYKEGRTMSHEQLKKELGIKCSK
ncbi:MAG: hypothetical protein AABX54_04795 [Nanoarchaeota archaeon]